MRKNTFFEDSILLTTGEKIPVKYRTVKGTKHYVFRSVSDYEKYFIDTCGSVPRLFDNWRLAPTDAWTIADDGGIVQVLLHKELATRREKDTGSEGYVFAKNGYVRTCVGCFVANDGYSMDTDFNQHENPYTFSRHHMTRKERIEKREECTNDERMFALGVAANLTVKNGKSPAEIYAAIFKTIYMSIAEDKANELLKQRRIMDTIKETISSICSRYNVTQESVIERINNLANTARREDVRLAALQSLKSIVGVDEDAKLERELELKKISAVNSVPQIGAGVSSAQLKRHEDIDEDRDNGTEHEETSSGTEGDSSDVEGSEN